VERQGKRPKVHAKQKGSKKFFNLDWALNSLKGCVNALVNFCDIAESVTNVNKNIESENF
jgi:hypothetical protein